MKNIPYSEIKKIAVTKLLTASRTLLHPFSTVTLCRYPVAVTCDWHSNSTTHFFSLILEGEMIYQEKGSPEQHFIAGDMVLLPMLTTYRWKLIRPALTFQCSHFGFSFAEHSALFSLFGILQRKVEKVSLGLNAVAKVKTMLDSIASTSFSGLRISAFLLELCADSLVVFYENMSKNDSLQTKHDLIKKCICFVEDHLSEKFTLAELAQACNISLRKLFYLFKEHFGMTPLQYIDERKLDMAKKYLRSGLFGKEIASELGFGSQNYFVRFFKQHTGMTPEVYKQSEP